ncbi:MAG: hypothetical protein QM820_38515 [Minicystis sp.]
MRRPPAPLRPGPQGRDPEPAAPASAPPPDRKARLLVTIGPSGKPRVKRAPGTALRPEAQAIPQHPFLPHLASRRSSPVRGLRICHACGHTGPVQQYQAQDVGPVLLCEACGDKALLESFGRPDVLDHAIRCGGFETNRRRH